MALAFIKSASPGFIPSQAYHQREDGFGAQCRSIVFEFQQQESPCFFWLLLFSLAVYYFLKRLNTSPYGILIRSIKMRTENRVRFLGYHTFFTSG